MLQWQLCNRRGSGQITIRLLVPTLYKVVRLTSMPRLARSCVYCTTCIYAYMRTAYWVMRLLGRWSGDASHDRRTGSRSQSRDDGCELRQDDSTEGDGGRRGRNDRRSVRRTHACCDAGTDEMHRVTAVAPPRRGLWLRRLGPRRSGLNQYRTPRGRGARVNSCSVAIDKRNRWHGGGREQ